MKSKFWYRKMRYQVKDHLAEIIHLFSPNKVLHDRFLILDHERLYHFGASIKDLSKKWFAFSRIDEFLPHILAKLSSNENE